MNYEYIDDHRQLIRFSGEIAVASCIAFDTEFVSEDSYRPELCLIQVAAAGHLAVIDPLSIKDLRPFWEVLPDPSRQTIVQTQPQGPQHNLSPPPSHAKSPSAR